MLNEKDVSIEIKWHFEQLANRAIEALSRQGFEAVYAANRDEALTKVIERIPVGASIGIADSVTLHQIGFIDWLNKQKEHDAFNPLQKEYSPEEDWVQFRIRRFNLQRQALTADVFVIGTNAITLDGKVINIDAHGNRVAAMIFGPRKTIFVSGTNKIVNNVEEALKRIKGYCSAVNVKRHVEKQHYLSNFMKNLPCIKTGICSNCQSEAKICRITVVIDGWAPAYHSPEEQPPSIIIVGEPLGI